MRPVAKNAALRGRWMAKSRAWAAIATDKNALRAIAGCGWLLVLDQYRIALRQGGRRAVHHAVAGIKAANHFDLRVENLHPDIFVARRGRPVPPRIPSGRGRLPPIDTRPTHGHRSEQGDEGLLFRIACWISPSHPAVAAGRLRSRITAPPSRPSGGRCLQHAGKRRPRPQRPLPRKLEFPHAL